MTNPNPPIGTSANLLLKGSDGSYEIYNIGNNQILAAYNMGTTGTDLSGYNLIGLGSFNLPDNNDILYQSAQFPYLNSTFVNVSGNNITGTVNHSQDFALNTQTFDDMPLGPITNGENGWKFVGPSSPNTRDQAVVDLNGNHVFHISSNPSSSDFGGPYSPSLSASAGESETTAQFDSQLIGFQFKPVNATPDGSRIEVDFAIPELPTATTSWW